MNEMHLNRDIFMLDIIVIVLIITIIILFQEYCYVLNLKVLYSLFNLLDTASNFLGNTSTSVDLCSVI
jgi:hypothetical protein